MPATGLTGSLAPLAAFPRLTALTVERCSRLETLAGVEALRAVQTLSLHGLGPRVELTPLSRMKALREIHLRSTKPDALPAPLRRLVVEAAE